MESGRLSFDTMLLRETGKAGRERRSGIISITILTFYIVQFIFESLDSITIISVTLTSSFLLILRIPSAPEIQVERTLSFVFGPVFRTALDRCYNML